MAANTNSVLKLSAAATNITTSAYLQLIAASLVGCFRIVMSNSTTSNILLAVGAAGSENELVAVAAGQSIVLDLNSINTIPLGARLSLKAVDTNATTGWVTVSLIS